MIELKTKNDHTQKLGIYAESVKATRKDIDLAVEIAEYMDAQAEEWGQKFDRKAWAIAHAQVTDSPEPKRIFVVHPELNEPEAKDTKAFFISRFIFNAELLEAPTHITKTRYVRKTVLNEKTGKREIQKDVPEEVRTSNVIPMKEGCMSFPLRKPKNVDRVYRVKVRYWYPMTWLGFKFLWRKTEWVEGLKAQIFAHECEHFEGNNIYYRNDDKDD